jgi:hypothetical protein
MANILKKPINSANIYCDSRKRRLYRELFPEEGLSPKYQGVMEPSAPADPPAEYRLWTFLADPPFFFIL